MKKLRMKYDWVLFGLLMAFLFLAHFQKWTGLFPVRPLGGVIEPTPMPELTFDAYKSTAFQSQLEQYSGEYFGFREPVIRIYNQYLWSVFHKTYCSYLVPGKKGWLYYKVAVDDYYGTELLSHFKSNEEAIQSANAELWQMYLLDKELKSHGITFIAFLAPDKPRVYPEYLPRQEADTTTVDLSDYYDRCMTKMGIPHINMTSWFVAMRDTVPFPLFPKAESHWFYSAVYGYDSLFRYMNTLGEPDFPKMHIGPPEAYVSDEVVDDESVLNLLFRVRGSKWRYRSEITVEPTTERKPRVLFVGDSFIWSLERMLPYKELMDDKEIWFYNNTAFVGMENEKWNVKEINRLRHILKADYVVCYAAGHQWWQGTFGFVGDALWQFKQASEADIAKARLMNDIERDEDWLLTLKLYGFRHALPLEEVLGLEADRVMSGEPLLREGMVVDTAVLMQIKIEELKRDWRLYPKQLRLIEEKAKKNGITFEEMLDRDARWVANQMLEKGELF